MTLWRARDGGLLPRRRGAVGRVDQETRELHRMMATRSERCRVKCRRWSVFITWKDSSFARSRCYSKRRWVPLRPGFIARRRLRVASHRKSGSAEIANEREEIL